MRHGYCKAGPDHHPRCRAARLSWPLHEALQTPKREWIVGADADARFYHLAKRAAGARFVELPAGMLARSRAILDALGAD